MFPSTSSSPTALPVHGAKCLENECKVYAHPGRLPASNPWPSLRPGAALPSPVLIASQGHVDPAASPPPPQGRIVDSAAGGHVTLRHPPPPPEPSRPARVPSPRSVGPNLVRGDAAGCRSGSVVSPNPQYLVRAQNTNLAIRSGSHHGRILLRSSHRSALPRPPTSPHPSRRGTGGGRRDPEAAEGDVIAGLFVQPPWR